MVTVVFLNCPAAKYVSFFWCCPETVTSYLHTHVFLFFGAGGLSSHGAVCLYSHGDAFFSNDMGTGVRACTVWHASLSSHGTVGLYSNGDLCFGSGDFA